MHKYPHNDAMMSLYFTGCHFHYFTWGCATRSKHTWHTQWYTSMQKYLTSNTSRANIRWSSMGFSHYTDEAKHLDMTLLHSNVQYRHIAVYRAFACDVSQRCMSSDFWCCAGIQVEEKFSVLHDAPVICTPNIDHGWWTHLTSTFNITTHYMLYVSGKHSGCVVSDFLIQAPIYLYMAFSVEM